MHNLNMWQKLALAGVVFMLPFAVVTWKMASSVNTLGVDYARQEIRGLEYYTPALVLLKDLQQHRGMAAAWLSGDSSFKERLNSKGAEIENDLKNVDAVDRRLGTALSTTKKWTALSAASRDLMKVSDSLSPDDSFARHTKVIEDTISLITDVGDSSHLSLDPSIDSYYLMNFLILKGPELSEVMAQAGGIGTGVAVSKTATPQQLQALTRLATLTEFLQKRLDKSLAKALAFNEALRPDLEAEVQASAAAVRDGAGRITKLAANPRAEVNAEEYYGSLTRSLDSILGLQSDVTAALTVLMNARVERFQREVLATVTAAGLGLLAVSIIAFFIMRDITVTLGRTVQVANQIAIGDLSVEVASRTRKDELGVLSRAFDRMVIALKETAGVAERIAEGDLAVAMKPRSERDVLGHALAHMVEQLSALVGEVQRSGIQVNTSVNEIAATAKEQQATASEIAATTLEIGATSREISATSRELVTTMNEVSNVAEQSATLAGSGQVGLTRMEGIMRHVIEAAGSINAKLAVLNEKAGNINQVVTTITKVADQTNLLSLNAAIEAEKAGEYGRGFAVVATEIRRLADQTAVATYDIEQMVKDIQSAVAAGVMGMDKFSEEVRRGMQEVQLVSDQLSQIIQQVQALAPRCESVNEGMQAQATGAGQISEALAQLSESAQQTVMSLRQSTQAIDGLNQAATGMRNGVSRFKLVA